MRRPKQKGPRAALLDAEVEGFGCQGLAGGEALQEEPLKMLHKKSQPQEYATGVQIS